MICNTKILIQRLKLQPVHGMAKKAVTKETALQAKISADMEEFKSGITDITSLVSDYANVVDKLNQYNLGLQTGIGKLAKVFDDFETSMTDVIKNATFLEQRNKELNLTFGISSKKAAELGERYDNLAKSLGTGGENIRVYAQNVNKFLPGMSKMIAGNEKFSKSILGTNQFLTEHMANMGEAAEGYQMYAAGVGKNSVEMLAATSKIAAAFDEQTGYSGTFAAVIKEIGDMSADLQMTYNKMPGSLEKSVMKAKMLGTSFAKIEAMATKMLSIEESVGQELEYQLLSGKRLVDQDGNSITEKLRIAKLSGNAEAQVEAMNDLLKSQGDIIDGNNYYAKQQLETLTGFTVAELTRQRQTQKLMEQSGMDQSKIDAYMNMDPASFESALKDVKDTSTEALLTELKKSEGQKTTDEMYADQLKRERTEGINVMLKGTSQQAAITGASAEAMASIPAATEYISKFANKGLAETIGPLQLMGASMTATLTPLESFSKMLPIVGKSLSDLVEKMKATINIALPETATATTTTAAAPSGATSTKVKDAIIEFDPADKFTLLASTDRGQLNKAADTLTGGSNAVVDPAPIATAVAMAIQQAMSGINIVMSGEKLNKAIEFDNRTING
jgi:hypothetical protein